MQNNECKDFINTYNSELANLTDSITISDDCDEIKFGMNLTLLITLPPKQI